MGYRDPVIQGPNGTGPYQEKANRVKVNKAFAATRRKDGCAVITKGLLEGATSSGISTVRDLVLDEAIA